MPSGKEGDTLLSPLILNKNKDSVASPLAIRYFAGPASSRMLVIL